MPRVSSIQHKILLGFVSVIILVSISITTPALYIFSEKMMEEQKQEVAIGLNALEDFIDELKLVSTNYGVYIANHPDVIKYVESQDTLALAKLLEPYLKQAKLDSIILLDTKGNAICRVHEPAKKGDSMAYQYVVQNALKGVISTAVEKGTVIPLAVRAGIPIKNNQGQIVGAISIGYSINNDMIVDKVKEKFGVEATLFMEDARVATTIMSDGKRAVGTKASPVVAEKVLKQGQSYIGIADVQGMPHIVAYKPLLGPDGKPLGMMFAGHPLGEYYAERNKLGYTIAAIALFAILVGWFIARIIGRKIAKPLEVMVKGIEKDGQGNISVRTVELVSHDEIGQLNTALNTLVNQVRLFVQQVAKSVEMVSASSEQLTANSQQSAQAASQVAMAITDVASGAEKQSDSLNDAVNAVTSIAQGTQHGADEANKVASITTKAVEATERGSKAMNTLATHMGRIERTVLDSVEVVMKLGQRSQDIGKIVETISGIAGQTNLLALNAAIEAARAGEQGRGFAVVADEVRKLAEQSAGAAKEIAAMIAEIQSDTHRAVAAMDVGAGAVKEGAELTDNALQDFRSIATCVEQVSKIADGTAAGLSQLAVSCTNVTSIIKETDRAGNEIKKQTQTVSAATEEQLASMEEIAAASQSLAKLAQELQNEVMKFKV